MARPTRPTLAVGDVLDALRGIVWRSAPHVSGGPAGLHRARTRGTSAEFTEYRSYRQGDEVRRLDWKLLARTDRAYLRLTEDHTVLPTTIVVDASASMAYPADTLAKWVHAARVAVGLAAAAHWAGDPVGLRVSGGTSLPPRMRRSVVAELAGVLRETEPGGTAPTAPLIATADVRGRMAIVSDFLGDADDLFVAARAVRVRGCDVHVVHIVDRSELEPARVGWLVMDPESNTLRRSLTPTSRAAYDINFAQWRAALARECGASGFDYTMTVSGAGGEDAARAVRRIVQRRGGGGLAVESPEPR